jgi:hypothetical protein
MALSGVADGQRGHAVVVGWVRDSVGAAIQNADVSVPTARAIARTDSTGAFVLRKLDPGLVSVSVRRLGFEPQTFDVELHGNAPDSVSIKMNLNPQVLDAVQTSASKARHYSSIEDFYRRRVRGSGVFITRDQIDRRSTNRLSDIVREVPGVRTVKVGRTSTIRFPSATAMLRRDCPPQFWLDGQRLQSAELDDFPARDIEGLEIYQGPASTPTRFSSGSAPTCGTVVLWTRIPPTL